MLSLSQVVNEARPLIFSGVTVMCKPVPSSSTIQSLQIQWQIENNVDNDKWQAMPDAEKRAIKGRILHQHFVVDIGDFQVKSPDGAILHDFKYNAPSQHKDYETMGEELICSDMALQDEIIVHISVHKNYASNNEIVALKNS